MNWIRQRPSGKPYWVTASVLVLAWGALVIAMSGPVDSGFEARELESMVNGAIGRGLGVIVGTAVLAYAGHWSVNMLRGDKSDAAQSPVLVMGTPVADRQSDVEQRTWSLELRGVGAAPGEYYQSNVWRKLREKRNNFAPFYSVDVNDYPASTETLGRHLSLGTGAAFRRAATRSVAYWPLPAFVVEPPRDEASMWRAAHMLSTGKQKGQLGVTELLWHVDQNAAHAQDLIEQLFRFFDENAEVPEALIASRDGDILRDRYSAPSAPRLPDEARVPVVLDNTAVLLVARSDRVDRYLRPYAPEQKEDNQNKQTDMGKQWAHFWDAYSKSIHEFMDAQTGDDVGNPPPGLHSSQWQAALPALWATIDNRGPGQFEPTPWLPVRWAKHQVEEFDRAPKLGHLHRPVKVALRDEQGKPLKAALQVKAMMAGWEQALETLPAGSTPARVFYDSSDNMDAAIALNNALHELNSDGHGLDLGNVDEGYDIGRRVWNLGVGSALTQIALAAIASYKEGGVTAVVYAGDAGSVSIQMVRPPSDEEKAHNVNYGSDPFMWGR